MNIGPDEVTHTSAIPTQQTNAGASAGAGPTSPIDQTAYNLLDAMRQPGCPVCRLINKMVFTYLDAISYESVNDPGVREELRKSLGYCAVHGKEWLGMQDTLGTAIIYRDVLTNVLGLLQARIAPPSGLNGTTGTSGAEATAGEVGENSLIDRLQSFLGNAGSEHSGTELGHTLARELEPAAPCPACEYTLKLEESMASAFVKGLPHTEFRDVYRRHDMGLCLPHFRQVLRLISAPDLLRDAVQIQEACISRTCTEVSEVIRKNDYRYKDEPRGGEFQAPARGVEQAWGNLPTHLNLQADSRPGRSI